MDFWPQLQGPEALALLHLSLGTWRRYYLGPTSPQKHLTGLQNPAPTTNTHGSLCAAKHQGHRYSLMDHSITYAHPAGPGEGLTPSYCYITVAAAKKGPGIAHIHSENTREGFLHILSLETVPQPLASSGLSLRDLRTVPPTSCLLS
jgi:hypothetical protein